MIHYRALAYVLGLFLLALAGTMLVPLGLIVKQPDLGTALMLVPVLFVMLWIAGARSRHLLAVVLLGVASLPLLWTFALKDYQRGRVEAFTAPATQMLRESGEALGLIEREDDDAAEQGITHA